MDSIIKEVLEKIEKEHKVKILHDCESGSRAWGFASKDSDYDVRFTYVHEKEWYLGIDEHRDVIELPVDKVLDVTGWEVRKMLRLFRKSNASMYEYLRSPVVYRKDESFYNSLTKLAPDFFIPRAGFHHYFNLARNCFENDLQSDVVKVKKYFYALRSALACKWIVDKNEIPPMEFRILRTLMGKEYESTIDDLLHIKEHGDEKLFVPKVISLQNYLKDCLEYCEEKGKALPEKHNSTEQLDVFFRKLLN